MVVSIDPSLSPSFSPSRFLTRSLASLAARELFKNHARSPHDKPDTPMYVFVRANARGTIAGRRGATKRPTSSRADARNETSVHYRGRGGCQAKEGGFN